MTSARSLPWAMKEILAPVVAQMFNESELEAITISVSPSGALDAVVVAGGERLGLPLWSSAGPAHWGADNPGVLDSDTRAKVASMLQDHLAESSFAWGQLRHYVEP